jgi:hypothetical protein
VNDDGVEVNRTGSSPGRAPVGAGRGSTLR